MLLLCIFSLEWMGVYALLHCIVFIVKHSKFVPDIFDYQEYYLWSQFEESHLFSVSRRLGGYNIDSDDRASFCLSFSLPSRWLKWAICHCTVIGVIFVLNYSHFHLLANFNQTWPKASCYWTKVFNLFQWMKTYS